MVPHSAACCTPSAPSAVHGSGSILLLLAFALTLAVHYHHQPSNTANTLRSVFAGVSFAWTHKILLGAMSLDLFAVLLGGATALLPIFARDILDTGPVGLGLLRAAPAVGALSMSLVLARWPLRHKVGQRMLTCVAVYGVCMIVFGLSSNFIISLSHDYSGAADNVSVVIRLTLMQLETPPTKCAAASPPGTRSSSAHQINSASLNQVPPQRCSDRSAR